MIISNWTLRNTASRLYERPLGLTEVGFYWDSKFNGTADTISYAIVDVQSFTAKNMSVRLFGIQNVTRTWVALKHQYPLLGSQVAARQHEEEVVFIVSEERLNVCAPEEVSFHDISSLGKVEALMDTMLNGTHLLSDELLARVFILTPNDQNNRVCVLLHVAHCITDGIANATLLRSFLDIVSSETSAARWDLEERLGLAVASERLIGDINARQKWRYAIGRTLASIRFQKKKGGHTLPRRLTPHTRFTPARSGFVSSSISREASERILQTCRSKGLTFGNVHFVLGQVALTRVLCRRYIRGDIDKDEWEYRRREPMSTGGLLNIRPFLDKQWYERGGSANISLAISFLSYILPFMPLGAAFNLAPGDSLPEFQDLLSPARFWLRCNSIMHQSHAFLEHPLFPYILMLDRVGGRKEAALHLGKQREQQDQDDRIIPCVEQGRMYGPVVGHGGSSFGNADALIPRNYPLSSSASETPILHVYNSGTRLHCRPAELYLGASTFNQQLSFSVFWDQNVFDREVVNEWLEDVRGAAEFYLGDNRQQPHL